MRGEKRRYEGEQQARKFVKREALTIEKAEKKGKKRRRESAPEEVCFSLKECKAVRACASSSVAQRLLHGRFKHLANS